MTMLPRHPAGAGVTAAMRFLSGSLLRHIQRASAPMVDVVIPRTHEGLQPLCAVNATACAGAIRRQIERGPLKAASLGENVRVEEIGPGELAAYDPHGLMFVNVNTPHDYERAKDLMGRVPGSSRANRNRITEETGGIPADGTPPPQTT